jgi:ADP-heptose:LPS heptosyltransferase
MHSIGVIRLSSLGDIILTEPVTRALKNNFPQTRITYFAKEMHRPVLDMFSAVADIITFDIPGQDEKLGDLKHKIRELPYDFDLVLDLHKNIRSRVILKNLKSPEKMTYKKNRLVRQLAVWFRRKEGGKHTAEKYLALLDELMLICTDRIPRLLVPDESKQEAVDYINSFDFKKDRFVVLAVGASHPPKHYPINQFAEVAEIINSQYGFKILVVEQEHFGYLNLFDKLKSRGILEFGIGLDLKKLAGILTNARLVISNDSGIMHLAAALGRPTAGLFGPTHPVLGFSPLGRDAIAITTNEECSPCSLHGRRPCFRDRQYCFLNMTPEFVISKVKKYLD